MTKKDSGQEDYSKLQLSRRRALQLSSGAAVGGTVFGEGAREASASSENGEDERDDDEVGIHGPSDQQIDGPTEVIKGVPETYSVNRADHLDFAWSAENGTVDEDRPEVEITFHSTGEQKVRVMVAEDGVPDAVGHLAVSVNEITIDGPEEVAVGQSYEFEVDDLTGDAAIQHWTVTPHDAGSVILQSEEHVEIEFDEEASPARIELEYETDSGHTDTASHEVAVEQIELQIENARLVQTVEDTRVEDEFGTILWDDEPNPDFVASRNASIGFDLDGVYVDLLEEDVTVVVERELVDARTGHPALTLESGFELRVTEDRNDVEEFVDAQHGIEELHKLANRHGVDVPVFSLDAGYNTRRELSSVEIRIESDVVESDPVRIDKGTDFRIAEPRTLRVGFIALEDPDGGVNYGGGNDGIPFDVDDEEEWYDAFLNVVDEAVEMTKKVYPVDEIEVYTHEKLMKGAVGILYAPQDDGIEAQDIIEEKFPEFDATILVVPDDYFRFHQGEDSNTRGIHFKGNTLDLPFIDEISRQPHAADLVRRDVMDQMTPAHEISHTFTQKLYESPEDEDHPMTQRESGGDLDFEHARGFTDPVSGPDIGVRSTKFDLTDGTYEVEREDVASVMSYDWHTRWADARLFQYLINDGFEPTPPESIWGRDPLATTTDGRIEVLSGIATIEDDGTATIRYMRQRQGYPMPSDDEGNVTLTLQSADGESLGTATTIDEWVGTAEEKIQISGTVPFVVPYSKEIESIVFEREGTTSTVDPRGRLLASARNHIAEGSFIKNPEDRLPSLRDKLDSVDNQLQNSAYKAAYNKLTNDVRPRVEEWLHDDADVPANYYTKSGLLALIDDVIARLKALYDIHEKDDQGRGPPDEDDHPGRGPSNEDETGGGRGPPDDDEEFGRRPSDDNDHPDGGPNDEDDDLPGGGPPDDDDEPENRGNN